MGITSARSDRVLVTNGGRYWDSVRHDSTCIRLPLLSAFHVYTKHAEYRTDSSGTSSRLLETVSVKKICDSRSWAKGAARIKVRLFIN